jgi:tetratricopeptide (TPR) repeat protein
MGDDLLKRAISFHVQKRLDEAERLYREILSREPEHPTALEGLGGVMFERGRFAEAHEFFERGLARQPYSALLHGNLGEVLRLLGRRDEALGHLRLAIEFDPRFAQAWNSIGLSAHDEARYADAESAFREALRIQPQFAAALINLANALLELNRRAEAVAALRRAIQIEPDNLIALTNLGQSLAEIGDPDLLGEAELHCRRAAAISAGPNRAHAIAILGNVLRLEGRLNEALACYQQALKLDPERWSILDSVARVLQEQGRFDDAAGLFERAIEQNPESAQLHANYASLLSERGRYEEAITAYRHALACEPGRGAAHHGLGLTLQETGRLDLAETCFREAIRLDPAHAVSWLALARLQGERGEFEESCRSARAALAIRPNLAQAYWRLAQTLKARMPDEEVARMRQLLDVKYLPDDHRALLHFGMAAVLDDRCFYGEAAPHLESANRLQARYDAGRGRRYDPDQHSLYIDRLIAAFDSDYLAARRGWGSYDPRPVFVLGLPRSGTTLVEQVLASHPQIHGAGELHDVDRLFQSLPKLTGQADLDAFDALIQLTRESAQSAAQQYLERLKSLAPPTARRVVDKMPDNFRMVGLIALLWPAARVIVCRRDLRDVAFSCWLSGFQSLAWSNDWELMARRFADYQRMIEHWRRLKPVEWIEVDYESLVTDIETGARRLIDFVGLDWDPACLLFHSTQRDVRTASFVQVRQPVHTHSIGRWRHYQEELAPLLQLLKTYGVQVCDANAPAGGE